MTRVVLDANVLISGLISQSGPPNKILDAWLKSDFELLLSPQILDEIRRVINYPRISSKLTSNICNTFLTLLDNLSIKTTGDLLVSVLHQDPSDNVYLSCALEGKASYLVTGNLNHFAEAGKNYHGIAILSPREFLEVLNNLPEMQ